MLLARPHEPVTQRAETERPAVDPAVPYGALQVVKRAIVLDVEIPSLNLAHAGALGCLGF